MAVTAPKGTRDVVPKESYKWHFIERIAREVSQKYGLQETRTPVFESTELFLRGVGDTTDIVQKEMYTFLDKADRSMTLKPEGTAGVVRMFLENNLNNDTQPTKMYYLNCPVFRYENPQAGRLREHHQFGVEIFGAPHASADAECIAIALELLEKVGVKELALHINSIGCPKCRPSYHEALKDYLKARYNSLCNMCKDRFERNPLRALDCKEDNCKEIVKGAPLIIDYLCGDCNSHMEELKACLTDLGVNYEIDPFIVRGLDYYTKTVFEIISTHIGSQGTVCGGGRYDGLVETVGGPSMPGIGFGMGMERLLMVVESQGVNIPEPPQMDIYIASMGEAARMKAFNIAMQLRKAGFIADCDHVGRSIKAQFKYADKINARYTAVIGENELNDGTITLKDMGTGTSRSLELNAGDLINSLEI